MVKITIDKKVFNSALQMLLQVGGVKSIGATPNENTRLDIYQTSISMVATSGINMAVINDIPIEVLEGDITEYLGKPLMLHTKKFATASKGAGDRVNLHINGDKVKIGASDRAFILDSYEVTKNDPSPVSLFDYTIETKELKNIFSELGLLTYSKIASGSAQDGAVFNGKEAFGVVAAGGLKYFDTKIFTLESSEDNTLVAIHPDFFSACLAKTTEKEVTPGMTEDKSKVVLKVGNCYLYKAITLDTEFPFRSTDDVIKKAQGSRQAGNSVKTTVNVKEFMDNLKDVNEVIESESYNLKLTATNITIGSANVKVGAKGSINMPAATQIPVPNLESVNGTYKYEHLLLIGSLFTEDEVEMCMDINQNGEAQNLFVENETKIYLFRPIA